MNGGKTKMKLPIKTKGDKLIQVTKKAFESLNGYKVVENPDLNDLVAHRLLGRYSHDIDHEIHNKHLSAHKYKEEPVDLTFKGKLKALYLFPVIGWILYAKEKTTSFSVDTVIETDIDDRKEYEELEFNVKRKNHITGVQEDYLEKIDDSNIEIHPNVKKELATLEKNINEQLK